MFVLIYKRDEFFVLCRVLDFTGILEGGVNAIHQTTFSYN